MSFDDPYYMPPADISGSDARAWEEKIAELLRESLPPGSDVSRTVESVELEGERPDTRLIIRYRDKREPGAHAVCAHLWVDVIDEQDHTLDNAASVASGIFSDWSDETLQRC